MHESTRKTSRDAAAPPSRGALRVALALALAVAGCAPPAAAPDAGAGPDAATLSIVLSDPALSDPALRVRAPSGAIARPSTPAPAIAGPARTPSGALSCQRTHPAGACDRCPDSACRQVRIAPFSPSRNLRWAMFCEEGDVREEALIACLCAGGEERPCEASAHQTVVALRMLERVFGGRVPPVGTRYRDGDGLRAVVDEELHDHLAAIAGPTPVMRCEPPDREGATQAYWRRAQRVRTRGSCLPASE